MGTTTTTEIDITEWVKERIHGAGGFLSYESRELPIWHVSRERAIAEFIIRCLANKHCEGSEKVVQAIQNQLNK